MTNNDGLITVVGGATTTVAAATILPNTSDNSVGQVIAYAAIAIGVLTVLSQLAVRVVKRLHR